MNKQKQKIIEAAQNLYLTVDETGNRKYSLRQIEALLKQKHKTCEANNVSIMRWAKKYKWDELFQQSKVLGVEKAIIEHAEKEQSIKEAKANEVSKHYKALDNIFAMFYNALAERKDEIKQMPIKDIPLILMKALENMKNFFPNENENKETVIKVEVI